MKKILSIGIFMLLLNANRVEAQNYSNSSLKFSFGLGTCEGKEEIGMGTIFSVSFQKSFWKNKLRIAPTYINGGFMPIFITDTRDQFFRLSAVGLNADMDILRYKAVSIFAGTGAYVNYTRGLLGTGGWPDSGNPNSEYFAHIYGSGNLKAGLRINPADWRFAFEITPFNVYFGNDYFLLAFLKLSTELKFIKKS